MPVLPLGLGFIARAVQDAGHDIKIINTMDQEKLIQEVTLSIKEFEPMVIGISVRNIDDQVMEPTRFLLEPVKALITICRKYTKAKIIIGGAGYSIFPGAVLSFLGADMGICGPGEKSFVMLLEHIEKGSEIAGTDPADIPGLYLPGKPFSGPRDFSEKLDDFAIPLPGIHLFSPFKTAKEDLWMPFQTRRGCPMDCSYCSTAAIEGRITRKRDIIHVVDMLSQYVSAGFSQFFFVDNIFNIPASYANSLCDRIIEKKLKISWRCITYPWKLDTKMAEKMAAAGCSEVSLGFESGSPEILKAFNKKFIPEDVRTISGILKKFKIKQTGFLLLGGPGENETTLQQSLEFAESLDLDAMKLSCGIRIYPGTELARQAVKEGIIEPDDDLLFPKFYIAAEIKDHLKEIAGTWVGKHPNWFF